MVPPRSNRISRVPPYSSPRISLIRTGLSPTMADCSKSFRLKNARHWPRPRSLATTNGVSVDVLSSGYLDVSVPQVRFPCGIPLRVGCPIRRYTGQSLFAAHHVLSQRTTSFIGIIRQGIPRVLFVTFFSHGVTDTLQRVVLSEKEITIFFTLL